MPDRESRSTQPASPRASSSSGVRQTTAPSYLSARSADVILSEVRPTRIKSEALRSVNVLLDELLWLILGYARSFAPDRLRMGLLRVLPTGLGKDALLEAEVELRAYIERNPPMTPLSTDEPTIQKFPLQSAFELLRIKCEAYSSLGDQTENLETESALHSRMVQVAGDAAPKFSAVAPAALYLTAILEHICEHVLSNVGRVVARDSSRTTALSQDLYVALCEDESIYSLFKTMKVQDQIEQQAKTPPPRRSKSISRNDIVLETSPPETNSDAPSVPKPRHSLDSAVSNGSNNIQNRTSMDKGRHKGLFKNSSSRSLATDSGNSNTGDGQSRHRRSNSLLGDKKHSSIVSEDADASVDWAGDDDSMQDFDNLMRSGTTMKVSLTPDRLKTFEVFAKEKNLRANRPANSPSSPPSSGTTPPSAFPNGASHLAQKSKQHPAKARKRVESIAETPEDSGRSRASSITTPPVFPREDKPIVNSRARSFTETRSPAKTDNTPLPFLSTGPDTSEQQNMPVAVIDPSTGMPKRTQRGAARRQESLDLDDVMDGSEDDSPIVKKSSLTPKSAQATTSGTRDLMDFLSEGPPEPFADAPLSPAPSAYDPQRSSKGRFRTIVSRLAGSTSSERLSSRTSDGGMDPIRRSSTLGVAGGAVSSRPPPLNSKRSVPNVAAAARSTAQPLSSPSSATFSSQTYEHPAPTPPGPRTRQLSMTRKAVPNWDPRVGLRERDEPSLPAKTSPRPSDPQKPLPDPSVSPVTQTPSVESNGVVSSARKRVPSDFEQSKDPSSLPVTEDLQTHSSVIGPPSTNGYAKAEHETVKPASPLSSRTDRRAPTLTLLSIPADELIGDLRRLMARATTADECRVLMDMFLAKCGAPLGEKHTGSSPITPPISPIRSESEIRHESNLIEVLLGDGPTEPIPAPTVTTEGSPTVRHVQRRPQPMESPDRRSLQPHTSPIITPAPSSVAATPA